MVRRITPKTYSWGFNIYTWGDKRRRYTNNTNANETTLENITCYGTHAGHALRAWHEAWKRQKYTTQTLPHMDAVLLLEIFPQGRINHWNRMNNESGVLHECTTGCVSVHITHQLCVAFPKWTKQKQTSGREFIGLEGCFGESGAARRPYDNALI